MRKGKRASFQWKKGAGLLLLCLLAAALLWQWNPSSQDASLADAQSGAPAASELSQTGGERPAAPNSAAGAESGRETPPDEDGVFTDPQEVARYLAAYGTLPQNYITKREAEALGWDASRENLDEAAPGKSIGGGTFGNYEGRLPEGNWYECDVNYAGGYRGAERLIYAEGGQTIYYTRDHYETFTQLY